MINSIMHVAEIFRSIQGEGCHTGAPAIFVRLAGCNLLCEFCDTDHRSSWTVSANLLAKDIIRRYTLGDRVVFTGGEPLRQSNGLEEVVSILRKKLAFVYIDLETNGTYPIPDIFNTVSVSPKGPADSIVCPTKPVTNLKIMYPFYNDATVAEYSDFPAIHRFLMPLDPGTGMADYIQSVKDAQQVIMKEARGWNLGIQIHKIIGAK